MLIMNVALLAQTQVEIIGYVYIQALDDDPLDITNASWRHLLSQSTTPVYLGAGASATLRLINNNHYNDLPIFAPTPVTFNFPSANDAQATIHNHTLIHCFTNITITHRCIRYTLEHWETEPRRSKVRQFWVTATT